MKFLILLSALALAVKAQMQSPTYQFNVTSPILNSRYVASQMLPCIYDIASNTTANNLQLSILLVGTNSSTPMIMSADITQGFSFQKKIDGGAIVYEHQLNYNIPVNTTAGAYEVVYLDNLTQTKVSIPISIGAAPAPTVFSSPADSDSSSPSSPTNNSIFNKGNSANAGLQISKFLLVASLILAFVLL
ncbi:hypothetical protein HPULCUR_010862 [Helicostylum pulchrum]|uniref:Uncharacterized protein n=1 Tax=Helicostylum pulchrum TaxID=562976 RepID=A0ABP9YEG3_9FUNG